VRKTVSFARGSQRARLEAPARHPPPFRTQLLRNPRQTATIRATGIPHHGRHPAHDEVHAPGINQGTGSLLLSARTPPELFFARACRPCRNLHPRWHASWPPRCPGRSLLLGTPSRCAHSTVPWRNALPVTSRSQLAARRCLAFRLVFLRR